MICIMAKVTGKFQITLPKVLAERCGIRVGDELELRSTGRSIQIAKHPMRGASQLRTDRLAHFDQATARQRARERRMRLSPARSRGWTREELYSRGRTR
jgi:AbrB family looped-hinge helix DNA binding protein